MMDDAEQRTTVVSAQGGGIKPCVLTGKAGNADVLLECSYFEGKQSYSSIIIGMSWRTEHNQKMDLEGVDVPSYPGMVFRQNEFTQKPLQD